MRAHGSDPGLRGSQQGEMAMGNTGPRYGAGQLASSAVIEGTAGRYGIGQLVPSAAVPSGGDVVSTGVCSGSFRWFGTKNRRMERKSRSARNGKDFGCFYSLERGNGKTPPLPPKGGEGEGFAGRRPDRWSVMADDRESRAAWVRENLPGCTAVAEAFRAEFGDVRLVFAAEAGHVIGKPGPAGVKLSETVVGRMYPEKPEGKR